MEQDKENEGITIKKSRIFAAIGAVVIISFFIFAANAMLANPGSVPVTGNAVKQTPAQIDEGKQVVKITMQGSTYQPDPVVVKQGVPVVFEVDTNSVKGCYRGIQIPAFDVKKIVSEGDNKIEFTPEKAGTFAFTCYMGMGRGQLVVQDAQGNVPVTTDAAAQNVPAHTCSSSGGGCGCGG